VYGSLLTLSPVAIQYAHKIIDTMYGSSSIMSFLVIFISINLKADNTRYNEKLR